MENPDFNKTLKKVNKKSNLSESPDERLINEFNLKAGEKITLIKRSARSSTNVGVGSIMEGRLEDDVRLCQPIFFQNGSNTTDVQGIYAKPSGEILIQTLTSMYELVRQAQKEGDFKKGPEIQKILNLIEFRLNEQPLSVRHMFREMKDKFYASADIDGRNFIFTQPNEKLVLALVSDEKNSHRYKTRVFRFSGSDQQWKSLPGMRSDQGYLKGEENHPLHHYVQSAKLHKDAYKVINALPPKYEYDADDPDAVDFVERYLPNQGMHGRYWDEFEFKENHLSFKNPEWASFQHFCQEVYRYYKMFIIQSALFRGLTLNGDLYKRLTGLTSVPEFKNIKDVLEAFNKNPEYAKSLENATLYGLEHMNDSQPELSKISRVYDENISSFIERSFQHPFPKTMMPDFSENHIVDKYIKKDIGRNKEKDIYIEEYKVSTPQGDELIFSMARDGKGRVYIDNIYDPRVGMNDYGIPKQIVQMGYLVYKPEEYPQGTDFGFPKKYLKKTDPYDDDTYGKMYHRYNDISALWLNIPVIKNYRDELVKRGVLK